MYTSNVTTDGWLGVKMRAHWFVSRCMRFGAIFAFVVWEKHIADWDVTIGILFLLGLRRSLAPWNDASFGVWPILDLLCFVVSDPLHKVHLIIDYTVFTREVWRVNEWQPRRRTPSNRKNKSKNQLCFCCLRKSYLYI